MDFGNGRRIENVHPAPRRNQPPVFNKAVLCIGHLRAVLIQRVSFAYIDLQNVFHTKEWNSIVPDIEQQTSAKKILNKLYFHINPI